MKRISYSVLTLALLSAGSCYSANTITFNGSITDATCEVSLESGGKTIGTDGSGTIELDEVSATELSVADTPAGTVPFFIVAKNCVLGTPAKSKVAANFKSVNGDNLGYLKNTNTGAGAATNVVFRLLDSTGDAIKVNDPNQSSTSAFTNIVTADPAVTRMPYAVQYYSTGKATAGTVASTVDYELMYQ